MAKIFDYKFIIILGLSLIVYFLYREVELLNKRVSTLEMSSNNETDLMIEELELPPRPVSLTQPVLLVDSLLLPVSLNVLNEDEKVDVVQSEAHSEAQDIVQNIVNEDEKVDLVQVVVNEDNTNIEEYSNDNDQLIEMTKFDLDVLLKTKLVDLQNIAEKYDININNSNGKKKKKVDLANEIFKLNI